MGDRLFLLSVPLLHLHCLLLVLTLHLLHLRVGSVLLGHPLMVLLLLLLQLLMLLLLLSVYLLLALLGLPLRFGVSRIRSSRRRM